METPKNTAKKSKEMQREDKEALAEKLETIRQESAQIKKALAELLERDTRKTTKERAATGNYVAASILVAMGFFFFTAWMALHRSILEFIKATGFPQLLLAIDLIPYASFLMIFSGLFTILGTFQWLKREEEILEPSFLKSLTYTYHKKLWRNNKLQFFAAVFLFAAMALMLSGAALSLLVLV